MNRTEYEWQLRAYVHNPNSKDLPYELIDDWETELGSEGLKFTPEQMSQEGYGRNHKDEIISHFEIELVQLIEIDDGMAIEHNYSFINKNGVLECYDGSSLIIPKYIKDQIKKWKHLEFYKNQYIET